MASQRRRSQGKVRPLRIRIEEAEKKLDKMHLQERIAELKAKIRASKRSKR